MFKTTGVRFRTSRRLGVHGAAVLALSAAFLGLGSATASADITKIGPDPRVSSRQAAETRTDGFGEVRGTDILEVRAEGEVRGSTVAVPGNKSRGFRAGPGWAGGPGIGGW